jgi:hypothetical protein
MKYELEYVSEEMGDSDIRSVSNADLDARRVAPKSMDFSSRDITHDFQVACGELRKTIPKGWHGVIAGSIRRGMERAHDLDAVLIIEPDVLNEIAGQKVKDYFKSHITPWHCDYRLCTPSNQGAMLLYLTGDRNHNIQMRYHAAQKGLLLNEYGLWGRVHRSLDNRLLVADTEKHIYERLGLCYLRPSERSFKISRQTKLESA